MSKLNKACAIFAAVTFLTVGSLPYAIDYTFGTQIVAKLNKVQ